MDRDESRPDDRPGTTGKTAQSVKKVNLAVNQKMTTRQLGKMSETCGEPHTPPRKRLNTKVHCDIAKLTLEDKLSKKSLSCSSHDPLAFMGAPPRIVRNLRMFDLVMELVSDYEQAFTRKQFDEDEKKFVELTIKREGAGQCPNYEHPSVTMKPVSGEDSEFDLDWNTRKPAPMKIPARPISESDQFDGWLRPHWHFEERVRELIVAAEGCGVGYESPVNQRLTALVRIYPNDIYELSYSLPDWRKFELSKFSGRSYKHDEHENEHGDATGDNKREVVNGSSRSSEWKGSGKKLSSNDSKVERYRDGRRIETKKTHDHDGDYDEIKSIRGEEREPEEEESEF